MDERPARTNAGSWWSRRVRSFACAGRGLWWLLASQPNARIHAVAVAVVVALGLWLDLAPGEWCAVLLAIGLVGATEAFNTALEVLADHLHPEQHPNVGRVKDLAAGAVLAAAIAAALIGAIVFGPKLLALS